MSDDIARRLEQLASARRKMQEQLASTAAALNAITDKIEDLQARQEARMRTDIRIDNKVVDQFVQGNTSKDRACSQPED